MPLLYYCTGVAGGTLICVNLGAARCGNELADDSRGAENASRQFMKAVPNIAYLLGDHSPRQAEVLR